MIIKIFKISTSEMLTFKNKYELRMYIKGEIDKFYVESMTINELIKRLPVEDYCRVK